MRTYKERHLMLFTEWLFRNRLKSIRLGALFLVWGWENHKAAIVAVRKSQGYIVRRKHRKVYSVVQEAIMGGGLRLCRWDPEDKLQVYNLDNEPKWVPPGRREVERAKLLRDEIGGEDD